jgi:acyl-CoA thioesterase FadM
MLLLVSFVITMLRSLLRPRLGLFDTSVTRFTVLPHDCDLNFHLNAGRYVSFMDVARIELIGRMRLLIRLLRLGWRPMMGGAVVRFRRSVQPFERFTIKTRLIGWDEKWFYVEHVVEKRGGIFCAVGHMRTAIVSKGGSVRPAEVWALVGFEGVQSPELPELVRDWKELEERR